MLNSPKATPEKPCQLQLVEILTGVIILGVLASMIPAVFGAMREEANSAICRSNLRTISFAILEYEGENGVLPGPTERTVGSPKHPRSGENIPSEHRSNFNVDMSLLLEDYLGAFDPEDPGPFFCRSNPSAASPLHPVYLLMRNIRTSPPSFFGDMDFRRAPISVAETVAAGIGNRSRKATKLSQIWMLSDIDGGNFGGGSGIGAAEPLAYPPVHDGGRNYVFFDGHVEYLKPEPNGSWKYPASTGDSGNHGD